MIFDEGEGAASAPHPIRSDILQYTQTQAQEGGIDQLKGSDWFNKKQLESSVMLGS